MSNNVDSTGSPQVAVIICAAGASKRFGGGKKKPFVDVAGRAVFLRSVELFTARDDVKQTLVAIPAEDEELFTVKWGPNLKFFNTQIYLGGRERFDTVAKGLELVKDSIELIAVHDAVRCCIKEEWVDACFAEAAKTGAAILACPVTATLKQVSACGETSPLGGRDRVIIKTIDRSGLYEAQTPQVFKAELLRKAYANLKNLDKTKISDDAQLVEALGEKVSIVETDASNIKITHKSDIAIAEAILKSRPKPRPEGPVGPYIEAQW